MVIQPALPFPCPYVVDAVVHESRTGSPGSFRRSVYGLMSRSHTTSTMILISHK